MDRATRKEINKEIEDLNNIINQVYLAYINRTFHPTIAEYAFFSSVHGTFSRIYHIPGHKTNLNRF